MRDVPKSKSSDLAEEFASIGKQVERQQKEFDEAMKPILKRLHDLAEPAERTEFKWRRVRRQKP